MINFKQYLAEARMAPLYHVTSTDSFCGIIMKNQLSANYSRTRGEKVIFLTRSLNNAKWFGNHKFGRNYVILQVNQLKLNNNYKIEPIHNHQDIYYRLYKKTSAKGELSRGDDHGVEFEEIIKRDIKNFLRYVDKILSPHSLEYLKTRADFFDVDISSLDNYNIEWNHI